MSGDHEPTGESAAATAMTVGCVVVVLLLGLGGGLSWFAMSRARVAERHMLQAVAMEQMASIRLPAYVSDRTSPEFQRVHAAVDSGAIEGQEALILIASITSSREYVAAALFAAGDQLAGLPDLTDEERAEAKSVLARLAGGVLERTVGTDLGLEVARGAPVLGDAETYRAWIQGVRDRCDALALEAPARRLELEAVVRDAVDAGLRR